MKKKKLSTISLNAATLDSQQPDYYNYRRSGLGTQTNNVLPVISDYNADLPTGFYSGSGSPGTTLNSPSTNVSFTLLHIKRGPGYACQIAFAITSISEIYYRNCASNNWTIWRKITMV